MNNPTLEKSVRIATLAGASIILLRSATTIMAVKSPKEAIMPLVSIFVGIAAFNYALKSSTPLKITEPTK